MVRSTFVRPALLTVKCCSFLWKPSWEIIS